MKRESLRVLVYKRTHPGDPDKKGRFGIHDCMGTVRAREFDAVIGVGGRSAEPRAAGIAGKITWIGLGPHKRAGPSRGPIVTFDRFVLWDAAGPDLLRHAPKLAAHLYGKNVRVLMQFTAAERREVDGILGLVGAQNIRSRVGRRTAAEGLRESPNVVPGRLVC